MYFGKHNWSMKKVISTTPTGSSMVEYSPSGRLRFNSQSTHTKDLKIGNLSTQLGTWGLSSRAGYATRIP